MIEYQLTSTKVCQEPRLPFFYLQICTAFLIISKRNGARLNGAISYTGENDITGILFLTLADTEMGWNVSIASFRGTQRNQCKNVFLSSLKPGRSMIISKGRCWQQTKKILHYSLFSNEKGIIAGKIWKHPCSELSLASFDSSIPCNHTRFSLQFHLRSKVPQIKSPLFDPTPPIFGLMLDWWKQFQQIECSGWKGSPALHPVYFSERKLDGL